MATKPRKRKGNAALVAAHFSPYPQCCVATRDIGHAIDNQSRDPANGEIKLVIPIAIQ